MPLQPVHPGTTHSKTIPELSDAELASMALEVTRIQTDRKNCGQSLDLGAITRLLPEARKRNLVMSIEQLTGTYLLLTGTAYVAPKT